MIIKISGIGFSKKVNVSSGSTISDLRERLDNPSLNTFYVQGNIVGDDYVLSEDDEVIAMAKDQKITLG